MPNRDLDEVFIEMAQSTSSLSYDEKIKVGSVIVKTGNVLSMGYNGTCYGDDNSTRRFDGLTKPTVVHSEANALMKLARSGGGAEGATIYCTHSPCYDCAKLLIQAGVERVVFNEIYDEDSLEFLKIMGMKVKQMESNNGIT